MLVAEKQPVRQGHPIPAGKSVDEASSAGELRAVRLRDHRQALGMAVSYFMTDPVFARLPFGQWSRVLVGQINRGHYLLAMEGEKVVGFVGWALTTKEKAEAWLTENRDVGFADAIAGEIVLINGWKASSPEAHRFLVTAMRRVVSDKAMVYAKRFYRDGRVRPMRLAVNAFVARHIADATDRPHRGPASN